jgi:hypothetical protein
MRTVALIVGLLGTLSATIISILYSLVHGLAVVAGFAQDTRHFVFGLLIGLVGAVGACLAHVAPSVAAVLLAIAGVAFFFDVGWWALLVSPFFLASAMLAYRARRMPHPGNVA